MIQPLIVVPCYNEEEVLRETTRRLTNVLDVMETVDARIEGGRILYVDDGSKDHTWALITELAATEPRVKGLKLAHNVGHQQALWAGLEWAANSPFDAVVSIDADLQDDTAVIEEMVAAFADGKDIVYGVRRERTTDTWFKRNTALAFYRVIRLMGCEVVYNHADFRLMSRRAVQALVSYPERNLFLRGLVPTLGFPSTCVYYDRHERFAGESKYPLKKMLSFAVDGITSFSVRPLQLITTLGVLFILIAVGAIVYALYSFVAGVVIPGWTSLLISVWFIGGAILTGMGIIGEYIGKIYKEVKRRPRYFIEKEL
jgi:glycosyltransferase involved in cell wall biosynthesis